MRQLRTIFAVILLAGGVFLSTAALVRAEAQSDDYGLGDAASQAGLKDKKIAGYDTVPGAIGGIIKIGLGFLGIIFFLLVLYAGFTWMTSMGNPEKVETAKGVIEGAAIGLIVVIASYAIATFLFNALETGSASTSGASVEQGNAGPKRLGDVCASDGECVSKHCLQNKCISAGLVGESCSVNEECVSVQCVNNVCT